MKVLSLLQPWATLIVIGEKRIETRSWKTFLRGELLIHASKGFKKSERELCSTEPFKTALRYHGLTVNDLPLGAIIGKVTVDDCKLIVSDDVPRYDLHKNQMKPPIQGYEWFFGDYSPGRYGWLLSNPEVFKEPIPAAGALYLWNYPDLPKKVKKEVAPKIGPIQPAIRQVSLF